MTYDEIITFTEANAKQLAELHNIVWDLSADTVETLLEWIDGHGTLVYFPKSGWRFRSRRRPSQWAGD